MARFETMGQDADVNGPPFLVALLEQALNRLLRLDRETLDRLGAFEGKVICLCLARAIPSVSAFEIYVLPSRAGLRLRSWYEEEADVRLRGTLPMFLRFLGGGARQDLFASGELEVSGDVELGRRFQRAMEDLDIDWEEQASHVIGDVAAHSLGSLVRGMKSWEQQSLQTLGADLSEYLQEESRMLASRARVEAFLEAVDVLRVDADRLAARLCRLEGSS